MHFQDFIKTAPSKAPLPRAQSLTRAVPPRAVPGTTTPRLARVGARVRRWVPEKKAGWDPVRADPPRPVTSPLLEQAHHASERKLCAMQGFPHPTGSQQAFRTGLAHLYTLVPSPRRAKHAGQGGVAVEGGTVPTRDWFLNLQILTSGGFR